MEHLVKIFKETYVSQIMWMILGALLIKMYQLVKIKTLRVIKKNRIKKQSITFNYESIISLDHGDPYYYSSNLITQKSDKELYISIPDGILERIREYDPEFETRHSRSFNGTSSFKELQDITGIVDLEALIDKHTDIVANEFLKIIKAGRLIFNGEKFGVKRIVRGRKNADEEAALRIEFYKTDYFTHKVFRSIYRELKETNHEIRKVSDISQLAPYYPFLTSFGMNALLIIDNCGVEEVVLAERSKYMSNMGDKSLWHVTMNEGLSITDIQENRIDLYKCVNRGLKEELGIREKYMEEITSKVFQDLFINLDDFEIGVTAIIKTEMQYENIEDLYKIAKDAELETNQLMSIKTTRKDVKKFLESNKGYTTKACNYALNMYLARQDTFL